MDKKSKTKNVKCRCKKGIKVVITSYGIILSGRLFILNFFYT